MSRTWMPSRLLAVLCLASATGCVTITTPRFLQPAPEREWPATLAQARELTDQGRAATADSLLARYASTYSGTWQAAETNYWRSVFQLQAASSADGAAAAIPMLRAYVAAPGAAYRLEADALLRAAIRVDTLSKAASALTTRVMTSDGEVISANAKAADAKAAAKTATADTKDQDAEIRRLKDELAKSKDELERIKKRLAEPPKKPPSR